MLEFLIGRILALFKSSEAFFFCFINRPFVEYLEGWRLISGQGKNSFTGLHWKGFKREFSIENLMYEVRVKTAFLCNLSSSNLGNRNECEN